MEERRLEGARLLEEERLSQQEIAQELGVSRYTVTRWAKVWRESGDEGLQKRKASGRPPRLGEAGQAKLLEALRKGAKAHEFPDERWTLPRIAEVLKKELDVSYDPDHLSVVMRRLGWSVQRAQPKAVERNEQAIQTWLETTLPEALKKGP
jgi:transposase